MWRLNKTLCECVGYIIDPIKVNGETSYFIASFEMFSGPGYRSELLFYTVSFQEHLTGFD